MAVDITCALAVSLMFAQLEALVSSVSKRAGSFPRLRAEIKLEFT